MNGSMNSYKFDLAIVRSSNHMPVKFTIFITETSQYLQGTLKKLINELTMNQLTWRSVN